MLRQTAWNATRMGLGVAITVLMLGLASASRAGSDLDAAMGLVMNTTTTLLAAVQSDKAQIEKNPNHAITLVSRHVAPHIDMQRSAKRVLGRHWQRATDAQRTRFIYEFRLMLLRTYATAITDSPDVEIQYELVRERRKHEAEVRTRIPRTTGAAIRVNYRLHNRSGDWKLYDVTIAGISLLATYRSSFGQIIQRDGMDELLNALEEKNRSFTI